MRLEKPPPKKGWFGFDRAARFARGLPYEGPTTHLADGHVQTATDTLKFRAFPGSNEELFVVAGAPEIAVTLARERLLERSYDFWQEPNIAMEFQSYIASLIHDGKLYLYVQIGEEIEGIRYLERLDQLLPETIYKRGRGAQAKYDQLVPSINEEFHTEVQRAFRFSASEVVELVWPLPEPSGRGSPRQIALRAGLHEDKLLEQTLLESYARAYPDEWHLPITRARLGSYADAMKKQIRAAARTQNLLFQPPTEPVTQYFEIQRVLRHHSAAARLREYILGEFNAHVLERWSRENGWDHLELRLRPSLFKSSDWKDAWEEFAAGGLSYLDVVALIESDRDAAG